MVSYTSPVAPVLPAPVGLDKEIQRLQLLLAARLTWLAVSYGKAYRHSEKRGGKTVWLPKVYAGDGEYRDVLPNDNVAAQGFFLPQGPATTGQFEPSIGTVPLQQAVDWIFWGNLQVLDPTRADRFDTELLRDVLRVFNQAGVLVQSVQQSPEDVFKGFTTDLVAGPVLQHPYCGFRVSLEVSTPNVLC